MTRPGAQQCWSCGNAAAAEPACVLCGAAIDLETGALAALILDIEAAQLRIRARLSYLHNKAMRSRCPTLGSKASVLAAQYREIGDEIPELRDRLREDVERKTTALRSVK